MFLVKKLKVKKFFFIIFSVAGILLLLQNVSASTISGTVYDNRRNPLSEVDVELQDQFYRQADRTRTNSSGRYQFGGLNDGNYTVRDLPFRYDQIDQSQYVEITTINVRGGQGNTYITQDFYLLPKKGSLADTELGVVFAQEVPKEAEKVYEQAAKNVSKDHKEEGILGLREAVKLFPNYYLALHLLGKELFIKGQYGEAVPILLKAVEVN
ncbi:MAG: carboxypeptidase regulatory-like domain-containing protein, partial [Acidobacteria bacterium]|nr:carboxypeptidase regulatory-like domain-containing protein [Acidobacteriota bacterium]